MSTADRPLDPHIPGSYARGPRKVFPGDRSRALGAQEETVGVGKAHIVLKSDGTTITGKLSVDQCEWYGIQALKVCDRKFQRAARGSFHFGYRQYVMFVSICKLLTHPQWRYVIAISENSPDSQSSLSRQ